MNLNNKDEFWPKNIYQFGNVGTMVNQKKSSGAI